MEELKVPHSEPKSKKQARNLLSNMRPLDLPPNINEESAQEGTHRGRIVTPTENAPSGENTTQHQGFNVDTDEANEDESLTTGSGEAESGATAGNGDMTPETHNNARKRHASRSADSADHPRTTNRQRTQEPLPRGISPTDEEPLRDLLLQTSTNLVAWTSRLDAQDEKHARQIQNKDKEIEDLKPPTFCEDKWDQWFEGKEPMVWIKHAQQIRNKDKEIEDLKAEKSRDWMQVRKQMQTCISSGNKIFDVSNHMTWKSRTKWYVFSMVLMYEFYAILL